MKGARLEPTRPYCLRQRAGACQGPLGPECSMTADPEVGSVPGWTSGRGRRQPRRLGRHGAASDQHGPAARPLSPSRSAADGSAGAREADPGFPGAPGALPALGYAWTKRLPNGAPRPPPQDGPRQRPPLASGGRSSPRGNDAGGRRTAPAALERLGRAHEARPGGSPGRWRVPWRAADGVSRTAKLLRGWPAAVQPDPKRSLLGRPPGRS